MQTALTTALVVLLMIVELISGVLGSPVPTNLTAVSLDGVLRYGPRVDLISDYPGESDH